MEEQSKLKRSKDYHLSIIMIVLGVIYLISTIIEGETYGTNYTSIAYGAILIAFCAISFYRFRHSAFVEGLLLLIGGTMIGTLAWHYQFAKHTDVAILSETTLNVHRAAVIIYVILTVPIVLIRRRRVQWHHRQIFEVAARPINDAADGFTSRPYPVGKIEYTREQIIEFGKYLGKRLVAVPHIEADGVILTFSTRLAHFGKPDLKNASYVFFAFDGNVSVNMSKHDYEQYKDEFTFDRLCESLGNLFKSFLGYYQDGQGEKIIDILRDERAKVRNFLVMGGTILLFVLFILTTLLWFFMSRR